MAYNIDNIIVNLKKEIKEAGGGGGGGTTVEGNPAGSATTDLNKILIGETIYGIPNEASKVVYDNTESGLTADDVQEAIDELNTGIEGISELIPSDATSSNKLATADDIPGLATTSAPGIVQPDGTSIIIVGGVISAVNANTVHTYTITVAPSDYAAWGSSAVLLATKNITIADTTNKKLIISLYADGTGVTAFPSYSLISETSLNIDLIRVGAPSSNQTYKIQIIYI